MTNRRDRLAGPGLGIVAKTRGALAPIGAWQSPSSGAELVIRADGSCAVIGVQPIAGISTWEATEHGGILTVTYPTPQAPDRLHFAVQWIDRATISIEGEPFVRI